MDREGPPATETARDVVATFEAAPVGEPLTAPEVAAELDCARTTAYKHLRRLSDAGVLATKKVGARGRVWWLPPDGAGTDPPGLPDAERSRDYGHLAAREHQFHAVFREAFDAILIADDDGRYVEVNPAACDLFGLPEDELLGRDVMEFAAEGYDVEKAWRDFVQSDLDRGLFPLVRADGEHRVVEFAATPAILPGRHLSVLRDVTERREAKDALEQERERATQYQQTLVADTVVELTFRIDGDSLFDRLSETVACAFEFEGVVSVGDDRSLQYVRVTGPDAEAVPALVAARPQVTDCRTVFESASTALLELESTRSPVQTLVEGGARPRSMRSRDGVTTLVGELGADANLHRLVTHVTDAYPETTVVAKRTLDRPVSPVQSAESLTDRLTDRQTEVLRAAYHAGYFEWPRASDATDLATSMGVATSTWLRHLRLGEAKLVDWFFETLEA